MVADFITSCRSIVGRQSGQRSAVEFAAHIARQKTVYVVPSANAQRVHFAHLVDAANSFWTGCVCPHRSWTSTERTERAIFYCIHDFVLSVNRMTSIVRLTCEQSCTLCVYILYVVVYAVECVGVVYDGQCIRNEHVHGL